MKAVLKKTMKTRGRTVLLCLTLAAMLVLMLGVAGAAEAKQAVPTLKKGVTNLVETTTALVGFVADGPVLRLYNNSDTGNATALALEVEPDKAPMTVNSDTRVENLNADKVDDKDSTELKGQQGEQGPPGEQGPQGEQELPGPPTEPTVFTARNDGFVGIAGAVGAGKTLASLNLPPGSYVLNAKAGVENLDGSGIAGVNCTLRANGNSLDSGVFERLDEEAEVGSAEQFALQAVLTDFDGQGPIELNCAHAIGQSNDVAAAGAVLTAIKVGSVQ
jgi:hypothetical protein